MAKKLKAVKYEPQKKTPAPYGVGIRKRDGAPVLTPALTGQPHALDLNVDEDVATRGYEKERLSLLIAADLARRARGQARAMGMSFNAFVSLSVFNQLGELQGTGRLPSHIVSRGVFPNLIPPEENPTLNVTHHHHHPRKKDPEDKLKKFGKAFYSDPDPEGNKEYAPWDICVRYAREIEKIREEEGTDTIDAPDYELMAGTMGVPRKQGFAAAIAYDLGKTGDYIRARYGEDIWDVPREEFMTRTQDVEK